MTTGKLKITQNGKTFKDKAKQVAKLITVEPLLACYQMALSISRPALDNLEFEKACRVNLDLPPTTCDAILTGNHTLFTMENREVQTVISNMHSWQQPVQSFTPLVLVLFLGSFSDRLKWRKPFLLMPVVGELLGITGCILSAIFLKQLPLEFQGLFQKIIPSLFGGQTMMIMATTTYIADVSSIQMRTLRLGIVQIVISVVLPTVHSFSGIFFVKTGYLSVLSASMALHLLALVYGILWIKQKSVGEWTCRDVFDLSHAKDTFGLLVKKSDTNDRFLICVLVSMSFLHKAAFEGESNVLFLYTQNVFQWTPLEYSYFLTVTSLVTLTGHLFGVPLFTAIFDVSDCTILLITTLDKILTNMIFGLAKTPTIFYIGVVAGILTRIYRTAKKSIGTKIVITDDIGKAQSLLGICDAVAPAISVPIYNKAIYLNTIQLFPAAFFFFSVGLYGVCCISIIAMYARQHPKPTINDTKIETVHK